MDRLKHIPTAIRAFVAGAMLGAGVAIAMPAQWSNLATSPWAAAWFIAPSFLVFAGLCIVTLTDFVSNNGADPRWLAALWVLSVALTMGLYALGAYAAARLVRRLRRGRAGPARPRQPRP